MAIVAGLFLAGCSDLVRESCIAAFQEQAKQCVVEENDAACEAAKANVDECKRLAGNEILDEIADWIREELIGGILTADSAASGKYSRAKDLERYVLGKM